MPLDFEAEELSFTLHANCPGDRPGEGGRSKLDTFPRSTTWWPTRFRVLLTRKERPGQQKPWLPLSSVRLQSYENFGWPPLVDRHRTSQATIRALIYQ